MHRFFVTPGQVSENEITICGADVNHIRNVLRMKPSDEIFICDGNNMEYVCRILSIEKESVIAGILTKEEKTCELPSKIFLFQSLPKGDKMEFIIQKAVELGVYEIIPMKTEHTVVKLEDKRAKSKQKRWQLIAESASKQSGRMYVPNVTDIMSFSQALSYAQACQIKLIPYELAENMQASKELIKQMTPGESVAVFIGPEGGFALREIEKAVEQQVRPVSLGKRILRTETAGLAVLAVIMFALE